MCDPFATSNAYTVLQVFLSTNRKCFDTAGHDGML